MEENYIFNLSKLLKYGGKEGQFEETGQIEFTPPNMNIFEESSELEQLCMGAMISATKNASEEKRKEKKEEDEDEDKMPTASEIRMILFSSQDIKFTQIAKAFKKIAYKTGKLDDKVLLTETLIQKMELADFKDMICGYTAFFVFPSLTREG